MKFLHRIKKLFAFEFEKKEEKAAKELKLSELTALLHDKNKNNEELIKERSQEFCRELDEILDRLNGAQQELSNLSLENVKVEHQIKNIVDENRKRYCLYIERLIKRLREREIKDEKIVDYVKSELENFTRQTAKTYFKTSGLVGKELDAIKSELKKIDDLCSNFYKYNAALLKKKRLFGDLIQKIAILNSKSESLSLIADEIKKHEKDIGELNEKKEKISEEFERTKNSEEHKKMEKLGASKKEKHEELRKNEEEIKEIFDIRVLKKFIHIEKRREKIIPAWNYIENPAEALEKDEEIKIKEILDEISKKIELGEIEIKEEKRGKLSGKINPEKSHLVKLRNERISLIEEIKKIDDELRGMKSDLSSFEHEEREIKHKQGHLVQEIEKQNQRLIKLEEDIKSIRAELEKGIEEALYEKIKIVQVSPHGD